MRALGLRERGFGLLLGEDEHTSGSRHSGNGCQLKEGAARHAEFFREIRRGNGAFLLNGRNDADEAVGFQIKAPFYPQYSTAMWKTK